ncbi:MAG: adenylate/guanylate cyclase domain-containing protein [Pseudomonadota bacterium]
MANAEHLGRVRLPRWLAWYLNYGLPKGTVRETRKQAALNSSMLAAVLPPIFWMVFFPVFDPSLWPMTVINIGLVAFILSFPLVHYRSPELSLLLVSTVVPVVFTVETFLLGSATAVWMIMMIPPVSILVIGGPDWKRAILASTALCSLAMIACLYFLTEPYLPAAKHPFLVALLVACNIVSTIGLIVFFSYLASAYAERAEDALELENARSEALIYNLLPRDIAARLKADPDKTIADSLSKVAILFADITDFTPRAASLPPVEVVSLLNRVFRAFDKLADKHGLEKIKTIGDAYMVAAGLPNPCGDAVPRVAEMALDMQRTVAEMAHEFPDGLEVRIGLHAGPAVAGVIGNKKLFYDVWGETVNTASRMESHGEPGRIQVTTAAKEELDKNYNFEPRGNVFVKGMGEVETWFLAGAKT